jgi:hypothetical protein
MEAEEMTKQELAHIARVMYDLQEYCVFNFLENEKPCKECAAKKNEVCNLFVACHGIPEMWGITKADIERLERDSDGGE